MKPFRYILFFIWLFIAPLYAQTADISGTIHSFHDYIWTEVDYEWIDLTEIGTPVLEDEWFSFPWIDENMPGSDEGFASPYDASFTPLGYDLGFDFPYYGSYYRYIYIGSNGFLTFYPFWDRTYLNSELPNIERIPQAIIAPYWSDMYQPEDGTIYYYRDGERFIVEYHHWGEWIAGTQLTFQVILSAEGSITFQYQQVQEYAPIYSIGIENDDGQFGVQVSYNEYFLSDSLAIRIEGAPLSNVTVELSGGHSETTLTNLNGQFQFEDVPTGLDYTLTPHLPNWVFLPDHIEIDPLEADQFVTFQGGEPFEQLPYRDVIDTDYGISSDYRLSRGASWADYDNDGFIDLFVASVGVNELYHNDGDGTFTRVYQGEIIVDEARSTGACWGDYDNDGDLDLFVCNYPDPNYPNFNNSLYQNNGDGTFTKIEDDPVVTSGGKSQDCAWGDYNQDGYLDLFVINYDENNFLYQNNGDGTFTQITEGVMVNDGGFSYGCNWVDYDSDNDLDMFVANKYENSLYHNNGDGTFSKVTRGALVTDASPSYGASWADYDRDGDLDVYVVNANEEPNNLYQNNGDGTFTKVTGGNLVTDFFISKSSSWIDFDNDGDLDLFVANEQYQRAAGDNLMYRNEGNGQFTRFSLKDTYTYSGGCAFGDIDNDGDLDGFVTNDYGLPNTLLINEGSSGHWVDITGVGTLSNRAAIGVNIHVKATINGQPVWQMHQLMTQTGRYGQNHLVAHFGLGDATQVDSVVVQWPSGVITTLGAQPVDTNITITEPEHEQVLRANFYTLDRTGNAPKTVQFTDISTHTNTQVTQWEWDFDNDGVIDSEEQHPVWTYNEQGGHTVTLIVSNGTVRDTLTRMDYIHLNQFEFFSQSVVATDGGRSRGGSWADYDQDGDPDLFVANNGNNFLYQNQGDGSFVAITEGAIVNDGGNSTSATWGDYDNDGDLDLFVTNAFGESNFLYQNEGDGSFTKITDTELVWYGGNYTGASWGDYDNDGDLDLFVTSLGDPFNSLFENQGDGSFYEVLHEDGSFVFDDEGSDRSYSCSWADYDHDNDLDLFVANDGPNFLYRNNGDKTFTRVTTGDVITDADVSKSGSWVDYDNDGDLDLFVTNGGFDYNDQRVFQPNRLYRNEGNGNFTKITAGAIVTDEMSSVGCSWADYNNDGDLDLFVANYNQHNSFYVNQGDGTFRRVDYIDMVTQEGSSEGCSWADIDQNGSPDLFVANRGETGEANAIYRNTGNMNHWFKVHCTGVISNSAAIGTEVSLFAGGTAQTRLLSASSGLGSQNSLIANFGVGSATVIDSLIITWNHPTIGWDRGIQRVYYHLPVDTMVTIYEIDHPVLIDSTTQVLNALATEDEAYVIRAALFSVTKPDSIGIYYGKGADLFHEGQRLPMTLTGTRDQFIAEVTIPASDVTAEGLWYRFYAVNERGQMAFDHFRDVEVQITHYDRIWAKSAYPEGIPPEAWYTVSLPFAADIELADVLEPQEFNSSGEPTNWSVYRYDSVEGLIPATTLTKQRGYFIHHRQNEPVILVADSAKSYPLRSVFPTLTLRPGWNVVPWTFAFPGTITRLDSLRIGQIWQLDASEWQLNSQLKPFGAFAVENRTDSNLLLSSVLAWQPLDASVETPIKPLSTMQTYTSGAVIIPFSVESATRKDRFNALGFSPYAARGWDALDASEPMGIGDFVRLYFTGHDQLPLAYDIRSDTAEGHIWQMIIENQSGANQLKVAWDVASVPEGYHLAILDDARQKWVDPSVGHYSFTAHPVNRFEVILGSAAYVQEKMKMLDRAIPEQFSLSQNFPNPFNPATTIYYDIPVTSSVTLRIYSISGQLVRTLVDETVPPGRYAKIWDGRNEHHQPVPGGIYIYRLKTDRFNQSRKMLLLK